MKKVVLDTNVLLISLPAISVYRPIFESLLRNEFQLLITEDIFLEYKEIIGMKTNETISFNLSQLLTQLQNVKLINVYYNWNLITGDPDDNKFVDCAISGNANYIVTNDNHFKVLGEIDFPKVNFISADQFLNEIINR